MTHIYEYRTLQQLALIETKDFNKWCSENGYLPHRKTKHGWIVIKA